jgi:hypothetical protein
MGSCSGSQVSERSPRCSVARCRRCASSAGWIDCGSNSRGAAATWPNAAGGFMAPPPRVLRLPTRRGGTSRRGSGGKGLREWWDERAWRPHAPRGAESPRAGALCREGGLPPFPQAATSCSLKESRRRRNFSKRAKVDRSECVAMFELVPVCATNPLILPLPS